MTPARWQHIKDILYALEDLSSPERERELRRLCNGDAGLRAEVESLLACEGRIGRFDLDRRAAPPPLAPERIGPYRIERLLGAGGMASVYLAERADEQYRKRVAIKIIHTRDDRLAARFRSERQILARLEHPYIARLLDGGELEDGRPYLVMEHIAGRRIDEYAAESGLQIAEILSLYLKVCSAVQFSHHNLIVHRDLKAGNVLVTAEGEPRLLDFGIAKVLADGAQSVLQSTHPLERLLTPSAASPEQVAGGPVTTASDVYSLAVLLYTLLTGSSPYAGAKDFTYDPARVIRAYEPPAASAAPGLSARTVRVLRGDLDNILRKALEKDPRRRYATVDEFAADLRNYLERRPVRARPASVLYRARKFVRRNRVAVAAACVVVCAIGGGTGASLWYARRAQLECLRAERRFEALRTLTESFLFEFHDSIATLPGSTQAREVVAQRALQYLDQLAADAGRDPRTLADLASAYFRVAQIQSGQRGPHLGGPSAARIAMDSDMKALAIRKRLWAAAPDDPGVQRDLLASMWAVAEDKRMQGDLDGALERHIDRLRLVEQLLSKRSTTDLRYSVAASLAAISDLRHSLGDIPGALESSRRSLAIRESLLRLDPGSRRGRRLVGISHEFLGYALSAAGNFAGATAEHRQSRAVFEKLAAEDAHNTDLQRLLFDSQNNLCESLAQAGAVADAGKSCRESIALAESMYKSDQANVQALEDLASAYSTGGMALAAEHRDRRALAYERQAERLYHSAAAQDPDSQEAAAGYIDVLLNLADVEGRLRLAGSCGHATQARQMARTAVRHVPRDQTLRVRLARAEAAVARCDGSAENFKNRQLASP